MSYKYEVVACDWHSHETSTSKTAIVHTCVFFQLSMATVPGFIPALSELHSLFFTDLLRMITALAVVYSMFSIEFPRGL